MSRVLFFYILNLFEKFYKAYVKGRHGERFEIFTAMKIQIVIFWVVTPCSNMVGYQRFGGPCCFHLQITTHVTT
jgi:hypothetical protein